MIRSRYVTTPPAALAHPIKQSSASPVPTATLLSPSIHNKEVTSPRTFILSTGRKPSITLQKHIIPLSSPLTK